MEDFVKYFHTSRSYGSYIGPGCSRFGLASNLPYKGAEVELYINVRIRTSMYKLVHTNLYIMYKLVHTSSYVQARTSQSYCVNRVGLCCLHARQTGFDGDPSSLACAIIILLRNQSKRNIPLTSAVADVACDSSR